jgi:hypothetical protein
MKVDTLIDRMVQKVNTSPRDPKYEGEVPVALRLAEDDLGLFDWRITRSSRVDWIDSLEEQLPARFPRSFRSLVTRYEFPAFDFGPIFLFANTAEGVDDELRHEISEDVPLSEILLRNGFLQFGRPTTGGYDPICFEAGRKTGSEEYPIVRVDSEQILCNDRIRVIERLATSFFYFVRAQLEFERAI